MKTCSVSIGKDRVKGGNALKIVANSVDVASDGATAWLTDEAGVTPVLGTNVAQQSLLPLHCFADEDVSTAVRAEVDVVPPAHMPIERGGNVEHHSTHPTGSNRNPADAAMHATETGLPVLPPSGSGIRFLALANTIGLSGSRRATRRGACGII
ncbi:uncharacterized protein LDX57_010176 [Aspergillus melleus]|uniref:uncharacterized protein n=1 Tax=Aspergillus melleus TaxID=138277 RepID=UPI001E8CCC0D|nr:uncharacterized protein LDX57_010176 [Aspergillus melleus]KAH8432541.1 hypothetical protein LDX57_010176 [Aspergillus melleus]